MTTKNKVEISVESELVNLYISYVTIRFIFFEEPSDYIHTVRKEGDRYA